MKFCVWLETSTRNRTADEGEEKCVGVFGWGQRNSEGNEWVQLMERNDEAIVQRFFLEKRIPQNIA